MANYYAAARSNYVHIEDREGLYASLRMFGGREDLEILIDKRPELYGRFSNFLNVLPRRQA